MVKTGDIFEVVKYARNRNKQIRKPNKPLATPRIINDPRNDSTFSSVIDDARERKKAMNRACAKTFRDN